MPIRGIDRKELLWEDWEGNGAGINHHAGGVTDPELWGGGEGGGGGASANITHQDQVPANNAKGSANMLKMSESVILEGPACQVLMSRCKKSDIFSTGRL